MQYTPNLQDEVQITLTQLDLDLYQFLRKKKKEFKDKL